MHERFIPVFLGNMVPDLRVAMRRICRAPLVSVTIVVTLAIGLGAAAAILAATKVALIDALPYADADRLVLITELRSGTAERSPTSYATLRDLQRRATGFGALEGYDAGNFTVGLADDARMLRGARVTAGFFGLLGTRLAAGRSFVAADGAGTKEAIVSARLAATLTGAGVGATLAGSGAGATLADTGVDATIAGSSVGATITVNGDSYRVVGVLPATFHFALLADADVYLPLAIAGPSAADHAQRNVNVVGRLGEDTRLDVARERLAAAMAELAEDYPDALAGRTAVAVPLRQALLGDLKPILTSLLLAAGLLVLIVTANLALLTLTKYVERAPEIAMRYALGAARGRIARQLLLEHLIPTFTGAGLAIVAGRELLQAVVGMIPPGLRTGMPVLASAHVDGYVTAGVVCTAAGLAVVFGAGPAFSTLAGERVGSARATRSRGDRRLRRGLVAAQIALTVVLLVCSTLLVASFANLLRRDVGFADPASLVAVRAPLSGSRYADAEAQRRFYDTLLERSASIPGVRRAALVNEVPGGGGGFTTFDRVDVLRRPSEQPRSLVRIVGGEYFATLGAPVLKGRTFDSRDRAGSAPVAVVSAGLARALEADGPVLGRHLRLGAFGGTEWEIIGVVGDVQVVPLDTDSPPVLYLSHHQAAENRMTVLLRTDLDAAVAESRVHEIVKGLDASVPVYDGARLDRRFDESRAVFNRRLPMILCGAFACAALALTIVALYALSMHDVLTRRRELAIRIALGGTARSIAKLVLRDAAVIGAGGVAAGTLAAAIASRSMQAVLYGVGAGDWRIYAAVAVGALACTLVATLVPAARAGRSSPEAVMRAD